MNECPAARGERLASNQPFEADFDFARGFARLLGCSTAALDVN